MRTGILTMSLAAVIVIVLPYACASGEPNETNKFLTLKDYLEYAESHNAGLKSSIEQFNSAAEQIRQAKSLPDPTLSYGYATKPTPTRSVFEVTQTFPWFGTLDARGDAAGATANSARQQYDAKKLEVFYQVKNAFYEYNYLAQAVEITKENLELTRHFEQVAQARYSTSAASHPDIIRAQLNLAKLEDDLKSFEKYRPAIVAKLNGILNRPASSDLPWPRETGYAQVTIDSETLLALVKKSNPELKSVAYNIEAAASNEKLAQKRFYPDIGVGVSIDDGMGKNGDTRVMPIVSLTLPIWRDNYSAGQRQAQAQLRQATEDKIQLENTLLARAEQVLYEFDDSGRKIQLYRDNMVPKAEELVQSSEAAYKGGSIDFLNLIDAQRTLLEYRLSYQRSLADNQHKLAELEALAGTELNSN